MQRLFFFIAYFLFWTVLTAQQFPFVHYTPKEGLVSNQIKSIYQDSKGRLYFSSVNGLSVYDGSRFINYTTKNGLLFDIVNCVMEMGDDSIWIVTNSNKINCLVNGKLKPLTLKNPVIPVINFLTWDDKAVLYAATDQGLFFLDKDGFSRLPFTDTKGNDVNTFITQIIPVGDYLLIQRDNSMISDGKQVLYLYNKKTNKITSELSFVYSASQSPDGRLWISTGKNILSIDTSELKKGNLVLRDLLHPFTQLKNFRNSFINFDRDGNCWLGDQNQFLIKIVPDGTMTTFTITSGLSMFYINQIFQDREGINWIATNNGGIYKLVHSNFSILQNPFGMNSVSDISFHKNKNRLLLYSSKNATVAFVEKDIVSKLPIKNADKIGAMTETRHGTFGSGSNFIFTIKNTKNSLSPEILLSDTSDFAYSHMLEDKHGNLLVNGNNHMTAIVNGQKVFRIKQNYFSDHATPDSQGNIWVALRSGELIMYQARPDDPSTYLVKKYSFTKELSGISPRSITIDKNENIWIGTRNRGIHVFRIEQGNLIKILSIDNATGLSENFIHHLACDAENSIWASSRAGLDRINLKDGVAVIENLTRQNNIYQAVQKVVFDNSNTAWGLMSNGLIKITPEKKLFANYTPSLLISLIKSGKDTLSEKTAPSLSYKQNNLNFYFSATSFFDEKQVMYSYQLHGGSNSQWSEPSNNATVSFVDLHPGNYVLSIKATFPADRYPEQIIHYEFSILPPWWQTWWFRIGIGISGIGILVMGFRYYYQRKLEKEKAILEKQQAIEKERTRIATDMHDDLGAGLSRIKFLSETIGIKKQQQEPIEEDINKIREYSHEMIDKMGEIVWALNEKNDSLSDLLSYTRSYAMEYLSQHGINCIADIPGHIPITFVSGELRRNIYLTVKEALHNVVKHAEATEVLMNINIDNYLNIDIKDNGTGFTKSDIRPLSNGLSNMQLRIKDIGGKFEIINENGTLIRINVPLSV